MRCSFESGTHAGFPVMFVSGDLDSAACPEFESRIAALSEATDQCVILDLLDVRYGEAGPLHAVVLAHREMAARGKALAVVCCAPLMDKLIQLVGIGDQVELFHSLDAAATYLTGVC
jgi:anti-sigma B factor antagonist